ncbi:MAG: hypothetical protein GY863_19690 [bacterium]|nr:hypothetical protein [bacterium]
MRLRFIFSVALLQILIFSSYCSNDIIPPENSDILYIKIVSGNFQKTERGEQLENPVVIRIEDADQVPVDNIRVQFEVISGGGDLDLTSLITDTDGLAQVFWTPENSEPVMKVFILDSDHSADVVYVHANTDLNITARWTSDINFPRLFGRGVAHDNRILESNNFLLFSDGSTDDMKMGYSRMAEETFHEVLQAYSIQDGGEFGISDSDINSKIKIYSNLNTDFPYGGFAFRTGYILRTPDYQNFLQFPARYLESYRLTMKHEAVHVIQFLCGLDNLPDMWPDVWFSEGIAVYISGNYNIYENQDQFDTWLSVTGNDNPVIVHDWEDLPIPENQGGRYYTAFGLAVKYLLHENGHGRSFSDVIHLYRHMASSRTGFADAFELHMGMNLQYYEDNFFDLMTDFLDRIGVDDHE